MRNNIINYFRYTFGNIKHKFYVTYYMTIVCMRIMKRAIMHDISKFSFTEMNSFVPYIDKIRKVPYGSDDYKLYMSKVKPALKHHYKNNDHHPEHHKEFSDMNIYQLIELLCDWRASLKKNLNGNLNRSFEINKKRFNMSDEVIKLLKTL